MTNVNCQAPEPTASKSHSNETTPTPSWAKPLALCCLVTQNVSVVFMMRYTQVVRRETGSAPYLASATVVTTELLKLVAASALVAHEQGGPRPAFQEIVRVIMDKPRDLMKLSIPGLLYAGQNNLLFLALAHLSSAKYLVTYQLKTLSTAIMSVVFLQRSLTSAQWIALVALSCGVAIIQIGGSQPTPEKAGGNEMIGFCAVIAACFTSGFAGVYMEKELKQTAVSLWIRNVQLALVGTPMALTAALYWDGAQIWKDGFFQGYDSFVWIVVFLNAFGGLAIAAVLRYADNIVKCFGTAVAVVIVTTLSLLFGELAFEPKALAGACLVVSASLLYGLGPPPKAMMRQYIVALMILLIVGATAFQCYPAIQGLGGQPWPNLRGAGIELTIPIDQTSTANVDIPT
eukprot:CAMPEP_0170590108 /NCGR_PEP_ID=MMETSP0224-20130122/11694_1 /TAXON_ID=285029 /ORGANISM="Togula jolla, Strain CCCM 725" /LENGTH=401 /DNA_ID=CAMNT_0010913883 /DNA_START=160 /DNA_END=1365 /DNA_ORIENTATION=-